MNSKKPAGQSRVWFQGLIFSGLLVFASSVLADEVLLTYLDDANQQQTLTVDINSSDAEYQLAANLILAGAKIRVNFDGKDDLEAIAAAVSAKAPDSSTAKSISHTILGVGASLGGVSVVPTSKIPDVLNELPPATPPVSSPVSALLPPATPPGGSSPGNPPVIPSVASPN